MEEAALPIKDSRTGGSFQRCVVLLGAEGYVPSALLRGLDEQGASPVMVDTAAALMVELARTPAHAVIVDRPGNRPHMDELRSALATYYPSVGCWCHEDPPADGKPRLSPLEATAATGHVVPEIGIPENGESNRRRPLGPDAGDDRRGQQGEEGGGDDEAALDSVGAVLTREELAMLLGSGSHPQQTGRRNGG